MNYFVDAVLAKNNDAWQHLTVDEVKTRLADSTRGELVRINQKFSSGKDANSRTLVEGAGVTGPSAAPPAQEPTSGGSLAGLIKSRQEARRGDGSRAVAS